MARLVRAYAPAAAWAVVLLALGSWSGAPGPPGALPLDKVAHLVMYGILGGLAGRGWTAAGRRPHAAVPLCLALLVGPLDEGNQRGVPGRSAEWADLAADTLGVMAGFALAARGRRRPDADPSGGDRNDDEPSRGGPGAFPFVEQA